MLKKGQETDGAGQAGGSLDQSLDAELNTGLLCKALPSTASQRPGETPIASNLLSQASCSHLLCHILFGDLWSLRL